MIVIIESIVADLVIVAVEPVDVILVCVEDFDGIEEDVLFFGVV